MSLAKITSEPPDFFLMTKRPPETVSVWLATSPSLRHSVFTPRALVSNQKYLAFTSTKQILYYFTGVLQIKRVQRQFTKHSSFCEILEFELLLYAL